MKTEKQEIILCQPDNSKSCAACCGLYNTEDHSHELVSFNLRQRTNLFRGFKGDPPDWSEKYQEEIEELELPTRKLAEAIYNCPFLGYLNSDETIVGCMLHPRQNNGKDWRDCAFYGKDICASHICISHNLLTYDEKIAVINAIDHWYVYGLVITDVDLVKSYFRLISEKLGEGINGSRLEEKSLKDAAKRFFNYTWDWKFQAKKNRLGRYYFSYPEYSVARIDYKGFNRETVSQYDSILVSLSSEFKDENELREAEKTIEDSINEFVYLYSS